MISDIIRINTLVDAPRLVVIKNCLIEVAQLEGEVAEVGVYKGGTARWICENTKKHVYLFDTFKGMPPVKSVDLHHEGDFADTSIQHVNDLLRGYSYSIYKGIFPRQNTEYIDFLKFSFIHLDVDIYDSVRECLEWFAPRMVSNSSILLDDYLEPDCPGAKLATDEFCKANNLIVTPTVQSQAIIRF